MITFTRIQHIIYQAIILLIMGFNTTYLHSNTTGILIGLIYLIANSKKLGDIFFKQNILDNLKDPYKKKFLQNILALILILAYVSIIYTLAYHLFLINIVLYIYIIISIPIIIEILSWKFNIKHYFLENLNLNRLFGTGFKNTYLRILVFIIDSLLFYYLYRKMSIDLIRSPWELVSYKFWLLLIISNITLIVHFLKNKHTGKNIFIIIYHFFLLSSLGIILYQIGYGYDSFIHQATIDKIASLGTIQPRLLLYTGQYGLTFFLSQIFSLPLIVANKLLLPLLFSLLWPTSLYYGLRYGLRWPVKISYLITLLSLIISFNFAIMTTPQGLSFLCLAIFIFLLPEFNKKNIHISFAYLLALMSLTIHPLVGIPLFFFVLLLNLSIYKSKSIIKKILYYLIIFISSLSLPLFFIIYNIMKGENINNIFTFNTSFFSLPAFFTAQSYSWPLDLIHNIGLNKSYFILILILLGLYYIIKYKKTLIFKNHLLFIFILLINLIITKVFLSFNMQIEYEKSIYANRIIYMITIVSLPILLASFYFWFNNIIKKKNNYQEKIFLIIIFTIIILTSIYFSYPVYNKHQNSKIFNITKTDIKTVQLIENHSQEPYIVLANQMIGAAAIKKYGFAHYYNNNFYYSMPLGNNNIYQNYLNMIEHKASKEEALKAMDKAQVNKLYFVVNNYWHSAKTAIADGLEGSDNHILVDNGLNYIFIYNR